jgi:hypothetical protein
MVGKGALRTLRRGIGWLRRHTLRVTALLALAVLLMPGPAGSQFLPSPCCAILSTGLGTISSALNNVIGGALNTIRTTLSSIDAFQRAVVWPQVLIDRARAAVGAIDAIFDDIRALGQIPVASATLPQTRQLEQTLLSRNPNQITAVAADYTAVYSAVPAANDASPEVRDLIDITDASAQAALKRAIEIDAIADLQLEAAEQIITEIRAAAPGSAPIIEAGAAAWLVKSNAYTQAALTELMRLRAIDLAATGAEMKLDAQYGTQLRTNIIDALKRR